MIESHQFESLCRILNGHGLICYKNCFDVGWEKTENYDRRVVKKLVTAFSTHYNHKSVAYSFHKEDYHCQVQCDQIGLFCRSL